MTLLVVDASVAVKWLLDETPVEETAQARRIIDHFHVAAPRLLDFELASILWVKQRKGQLTPEQARSAALVLHSAPVRRIDDDGLWLRALALAAEVDHSPYDCAYVACGLVCGAQAVVTADRGFVRAFQAWRSPGLPDRPYVVPVAHLDVLGQAAPRN